jgi:hypothetical protein
MVETPQRWLEVGSCFPRGCGVPFSPAVVRQWPRRALWMVVGTQETPVVLCPSRLSGMSRTANLEMHFHAPLVTQRDNGHKRPGWGSTLTHNVVPCDHPGYRAGGTRLSRRSQSRLNSSFDYRMCTKPDYLQSMIKCHWSIWSQLPAVATHAGIFGSDGACPPMVLRT